LQSSDGDWLYFTKHSDFESGPLWKMPVKGGSEAQVVDSVYWRNFAITSRAVYFMVKTGSQSSIHRYDLLNGRRTQHSVTPNHGFMGLTVSPDERWLVYAQIDRYMDYLMLADNFR
jgi:hypothetical protein